MSDDGISIWRLEAQQKRLTRGDRSAHSDRKFFERFPHRRHRVRLASTAEIEQAEIAGGKPMTVPPGYRVFSVVRNIATGARMRFFVVNVEDAETDLSEAVARAIWEAEASPYMREVEARTRTAWRRGHDGAR